MATNYVYTDLSAKDAVHMEILGERYEIVQFSASYAANEIPTAAVMLALGRDVRETRLGKKAKIHETARNLKQMEKVTVWFTPKGTFDRGASWPEQKVKIFEGFFTGFAYRKISGKVHVISNLIHWSAALSFSSALTKNGHVSNPTALNVAAVLSSLDVTNAGEGNYLSQLVSQGICGVNILNDFWVSIKDIFCALASVETMSCGIPGQCGGDDNFAKNDVALEALNRIEGPSSLCKVPYKHGVALKMEVGGIQHIGDAVSAAVGTAFIESYSGVSFWDKLVGQICPTYGLAFVPMVESAIVVADTPAYNGGFWKEINADDYDSYDMTRELHRPLRGVGIVTGYESQTKSGINAASGETPILGGCYAEKSVAPGDGMIMYVSSPSWLTVLHTQGQHVKETSGLDLQEPIKGAISPEFGVPDTADATGNDVGELYNRYAREVFVNQMLRGQAGSFSGKLRFDIAPLSILKVKATTDKFIGAGQDDLAFDIFGCVQRVTISINAEAGMAGTTFTLSHVRTAKENSEERTSVSEHPLFGKTIHGGGKHGSPLLDVYDNLLVGDGPAPPPTVA